MMNEFFNQRFQVEGGDPSLSLFCLVVTARRSSRKSLTTPNGKGAINICICPDPTPFSLIWNICFITCAKYTSVVFSSWMICAQNERDVDRISASFSRGGIRPMKTHPSKSSLESKDVSDFNRELSTRRREIEDGKKATQRVQQLQEI